MTAKVKWVARCVCGWEVERDDYRAAARWAAHHKKEFTLSRFSPLYTQDHLTKVERA